MTRDAESLLRPLVARSGDLELLRREGARAAPVVRVAAAVEATLRRVLRDDPAAAIELRLSALSPEDLPAADLLRELRSRERIPVEMAAGVHDLLLLSERIAAGAEPSEDDAALALTVAERVETHLRARRAVPVRDPALDGPTGRATDADDVLPRRPLRRPPWTAVAVLAGIVLLLVFAIRMRAGNDTLRRGEEAYRAGRLVEAEGLLRTALERDPGDPRPRVHLARIMRDQGRARDAEAMVVEGLRAAPESAELHVERGYLMLDDGRAGEAVTVFRQALRLDRESHRAWAGLVRALRLEGRAADAEQVLRLAPPELRALLRTADERAAPR